MRLSILSLNIGGPSKERAIEQIKWLDSRKEDIFILTESKNNEGCNLIASHFKNLNKSFFFNSDLRYDVIFPTTNNKDLGVMCISRSQTISSFCPFNHEERFHMRCIDININQNKKPLRIFGIYVPSRDESESKIERKKTFINNLLQLIKVSEGLHILSGDFNIVDREHIPKYQKFKDWEYDFYNEIIKNGYIDAFKLCNPHVHDYSWVGKTGDGYRYDYFFVHSSIVSVVSECYFLHEPREKRLSDHSAIILELNL